MSLLFHIALQLIGYTNSYNDVNFYRFNAHGDVTSVVDCFGNVVRNYEYDAFGKQRVNPKVVINTRRDDNPFRYCGEYFDSETNLIYLRARYYNPDLQRFLSEDPVKDGENWYVYCGNNPVTFIDPFGNYYIIENKSYCNCMDPRCKNFAVSTSTYTIYKDTMPDGIRKSSVDLLPAGFFINIMLESGVGVVGGESASYNNLRKNIGEDILFSFLERGTESASSDVFKTMSKSISAFEYLYGLNENLDTAYTENIIFELFDRNNISRTSSNINHLDELMAKAYSFVQDGVNSYYYYYNFDGRSTLHQYDTMIMNSKDPQATIESLSSSYWRSLFGIVPYNKMNEYVDGYRNILNGYKDRISYFDNSFKEAVG